MSSTPPRRPILIGPLYAKNLERGQGGVWLNGILIKLLSRLSVFSGACAPSFFFIMLLAEVRFDCHIVLRGRAATVSEVEVVRCITSRSVVYSMPPKRRRKHDILRQALERCKAELLHEDREKAIP